MVFLYNSASFVYVFVYGKNVFACELSRPRQGTHRLASNTKIQHYMHSTTLLCGDSHDRFVCEVSGQASILFGSASIVGHAVLGIQVKQ